MAQAKKKMATKTAKKPMAKKAGSCKKSCGYKSVSGAEKFHMFFILAMALIAGILLAANVAIANA